MVRSSTSLTPSQKHHAFFFFSGEGAFFSRTETYGIRIWPSKKKKKEQLLSVSGFFSLCEERDAKNEEEGDMRTKQPDLCSLITRIFRVSLLSSLSAFFPVFFFLPLTKEKEEEKKKKKRATVAQQGAFASAYLASAFYRILFFFFSF